MWIFFVVTLVSIWYLWTKQKLSYWNRRGVTGPKPNFVFGNVGPTITFAENMGSLTEKWYK